MSKGDFVIEWVRHFWVVIAPHIISRDLWPFFTIDQSDKEENPIPLNHSNFFCHFYDNPFKSLTLLWSISLQKSLVGDLLSLLSIFRLCDRKIRLDVWIGQFWKSFFNTFSTDKEMWLTLFHTQPEQPTTGWRSASSSWRGNMSNTYVIGLWYFCICKSEILQKWYWRSRNRRWQELGDPNENKKNKRKKQN